MNLNDVQPKACEPEEAIGSDDESLIESLRYEDFQHSTLKNDSTFPSLSQNMSLTINDNANISASNIQIPIIGYEIMEERARFTVYKLRIENKVTGNCWYVYRRYTDFLRLCNRLKSRYPQIIQHLPRKRWLKNNFDPTFLEERINGLQVLVNFIISSNLLLQQEIQDFFCLNESPVNSEANEEAKAMFLAMEETIHDLKQQLQEKESFIDSLQTNLHTQVTVNNNLKKIIRNATMSCCKCQKEYENFNQLLK